MARPGEEGKLDASGTSHSGNANCCPVVLYSPGYGDLPAPGASLVHVEQLAGTVAKNVGDRPFMIMTSAGHGPNDDATLERFWANLSGWRLFLILKDSGHYTYTDDEEF